MPASAGMTGRAGFSPFCFSFVIPAQAGIYFRLATIYPLLAAPY